MKALGDPHRCGCPPGLFCGHRLATAFQLRSDAEARRRQDPLTGIPAADQPLDAREAAAARALRRTWAAEVPAARNIPDPAEELRTEILAPYGLDCGQLTRAVPDRPAGSCAGCHTPLRPGESGTCWYCDEAGAYQRKAAARLPAPVPAVPRRDLRNAAALILAGLALAACALALPLWSGILGPAALILIAFACRRVR